MKHLIGSQKLMQGNQHGEPLTNLRQLTLQERKAKEDSILQNNNINYINT